MSAEPPTLAQQIEAIEWALDHAVLVANSDKVVRDLKAAIETLKHLEFMRETL
jgi:hypothetical protein